MKKLLLLVLLLTSTTAHSAEGTLRGLDVINVVIENLDDGATSCGITKESIRVAAESPLSQSRIRVVENRGGSKGYVYVQVTMLFLENTWCAYSVNVQFKSPATLKSNNAYVVGSIWNRSFLGAASRSIAARKVSNSVKERTNEFIIEWTRDNPR
ncbi:MAG: hypothetical protein OEP48_02230 [Betaproteobacteria bacterium]|nr:hypothetical protein [Betaproteobacteria bacterium]MDH3412202.1 hypothetical protein [Gammaproteobacteria bacterium]